MKEEIIKLITAKLEFKMAELQKNIDSAQASANEEGKSSAGDKYETGRAMAQNTRAMYEQQLYGTKAELDIVNGINFIQKFTVIKPGALVSTNIGIFFIAIGLGKIKLNETELMIISINSPIGVVLNGKTIADEVSFNGRKINILEVK